MPSPSPRGVEQSDNLWLRRAVIQQLECLQAAGVLEMKASHRDTSDLLPEVPSDGLNTEQPMKPATISPDLISLQPEMTLAECEKQLKIVQDEVSHCTLCDELVANRTQTVFGVGNPRARLVFFGEAPGADEDKQGEPFVGRAGKLLNDIISKGMGFERDDVYIMNVVKCRPPSNRNPTPAEAVNCRPFFERQIEIIRPEFICCLGAVAATTLLNTNESIGRLRGRLHDYRGVRVLATYHPAYLLRNPPAKKEVWKDIQLLMAAMDIAPPSKK